MKILWNEEKNKVLKKTRGVSFEEVETNILKNHYITIIDNKSEKYKNQFIFIMKINNYIFCIPFMNDSNNNIFLKTIYPSRKYNKIYLKK